MINIYNFSKLFLLLCLSLIMILAACSTNKSDEYLTKELVRIKTTPQITPIFAPQLLVDNLANKYVRAHNIHRSNKNLPPLVWSIELAKIAQEWVDSHAHSGCGALPPHRPDSYLNLHDLGENISMNSASPNPPTRGPKGTVDDWASEEQYYDYDQNSCTPGQQCGHYTQVVWAATTEVGCGESTCISDGWVNKTWACNYRPAGNVTGQKPY